MSDPVVAESTVSAPVAVVARDVDAVTAAFIAAAPHYKMRKTNSKTFRPITLVTDEDLNWKKGLVFLAARFSKGVNLEFWMYGAKGGAHLAEYNDQISALASDVIKCESCGLAKKLRIQIKDTATDEEMNAQITAFLAAIEPTVNEIREKVQVVVSKKETKAKKVKEVPAVPEIIEGAPVVAETKKSSKSKSKSKVQVAA